MLAEFTWGWFFSQLLISLTGVFVSAYVALAGIRRADKRERDKRRHDAIAKIAVDFLHHTRDDQMKVVFFIGKAFKKGPESQELYHATTETFLHKVQTIQDLLRILNENGLADDVEVYYNARLDVCDTIIERIQGVWRGELRWSDPEATKLFWTVLEKHDIALNAFKRKLPEIDAADRRWWII